MVSSRHPVPDRVGFLTHTPRLRVPKPPLRPLSLRRLIELAPKRVSHVIHIFKMQPSNTIEVKTRLLLGIEPNESSSWRAAWVSLSAVQHCAYSCSNRVQVCVDAHAMAALEVAGGTSSTAVLGSFDSSRRTPPWRFHWNFYMIGNEGLRLREGKTETLTRTGHVSSCT
jgi:hypothetical protein